MSIEVTMPVLGLTMEEGTVAEWLKHEGDTVAKDEPLLLVEMDKGTVEVPAPAAGVLERIIVPIGVTVPVKTLIAHIGTGAPVSELEVRNASAGSGGGAVGAMAMPRGDGNAATTYASGFAAAITPGQPEVASAGGAGERQFVTPRARLRARELGVDVARVHGSGPHGRVVEADVLAAAAANGARAAVALDRSSVAARETAEALERAEAQQATSAASDGVPAVPGTVEPMGRLRRITAERMLASAQATARVTLFLDADFSEAARFRQQLQPEFARLGVAKLPWDALIAKAAALALVEHRALARQWVDEGRLRQVAAVNVGVAVALEPEGLVVPVLRNADRRSLRELAAELVALTDRARANRLTAAEMHGGTFTITNLGAYRVDGFTPIINPPETAILGVGRIADKAVVVDGRVEVRTMSTLSLSFDHRLVDGAPAAAFLARLAELLERPYTLLGI